MNETPSLSAASKRSLQKTESSTKCRKESIECLKCKQNIILCDELVDSLILERNTFAFTPKQERRDFNIFSCRICDYANLLRDTMTDHVANHFISNNILYCIDCQILANELILGFIEFQEHPIPYSSLLKERNMVVQCDLQDFVHIVPSCGFCHSSFGYLVPVVNKIIQRLENRRYECNICHEMNRSIKEIFEHAQQHVNENELFCLDCINQYNTKEEIFFPSSEMKTNAGKMTISLPKENERIEPTETEYKYFSDLLMKATIPMPPIPISSSSSNTSDTSGSPEPEPFVSEKQTRRGRFRSTRFRTSSITNALHFSLAKEVTCFAWVAKPKDKVGSLEEIVGSRKNSIFICSTCNKGLGGWGYAIQNIFMREKIKVAGKKTTGHFVCQICNFISETWSPMEKHILSHLEKKDIHCKDCTKQRKTKLKAINKRTRNK